MLKNANSYYLLLTYLVLKKETNENKSLSVDEVVDIIQREFRMDKKIDKRTIASHFQRLDDLSELAIDEDVKLFNEEIVIKNDKARILHNFDPTEIRLLADVISFSKLIDQNYSYELIGKIFALGGQDIPYRYEAQLRYKFNAARYNPQLFLSVEKLAKAIQNKNKVELTYLTYDVNQNLVPRYTVDGEKRRVIAPYSIIWSANFYYVLCMFEDTKKIYFLRTDKMKDLLVLEDETVEPLPDGFVIHEYVKTQSHLFGGAVETISFTAERRLLDQVIDAFGSAAKITEVNNKEIQVELQSSYGTMKAWLIQYITGVKNIYPERLKKDLVNTLKGALDKL